MESTEAEKTPNENFETFDQPFESSSEGEWNPTDCSEDEFETDITTSVIHKRKRNNNCVTQQFKFNCTVENCQAVYRKKWLLEDHIRKHNKERPFKCTTEECNKSFTKEAHLKRHKILVHEKSCELVCDVKGCGLIYNNKYSLKKHKNQIHNALKWPFFCHECCIGFKKKWQLNQHNYKHTGDPPFKCTLCNIGFTLQRDLTKHNRNHKTYTCDCGQIFERWSHLNLHNKKCSIKKDLSCKICDKKFSKKENLNAHHASLHQESKEPELFHCPYLNCTRSYKYKKNVNFHVSFFHEKSNQKEIPCPTCGKIFHMQVYLKRHIEKMHKLPKIAKLRATRKDKNKSRTCTAAVLAGLKLSQKGHIELLKNHKKLIIQIPRIDLSEFETKLNKFSDDLEQRDSSELIKDLALIEQTNNIEDIVTSNFEKTDKSIMIEDNNTNCNKLKDLEHNTQLKNLNDINNQREESDNGVIENVIQTCHKMKNISRKDVTEIENKVNKSNDVKQTDINKLKEIDLIEQTNNTDIVLLNLWKKTGTLSDDKSITIQDNSTNSDSIIDLEQNIQTIPENSVNSDTIIDLEQIIKPNNVYFMINNEGLEESINRVLENEIQTIGYERGTNISRKDVTEIENKINKSNDVKQTDTNKLKEIVLIEQTNKTRDIVLLNLKNTTSMSSEDKSIAIHDNSINSDSITVLEHNIQLKNLTDKVNNHNEVLENVERTKDHQISTNISRTDVTEIENKVNKSNNVEKTDTGELKEIPSMEQTKKENIVILNLGKTTETLPEISENSDTIIDLEQIIKPNNVNFMINNKGLKGSVNKVLENEIQTGSNKLKEVVLIKQMNNTSDIVLLNLENIMGTLSEDKSITIQDNSIHSDSIIDLEQNIQLTNLTDKVNNPVLEACDNEILENVVQTTEGHQISKNISRIDVMEIENKVNKSNNVEQTDTSELKEIPLIEQTQEESIVIFHLGITETLPEISVHSDTIIDLEHIKPNNVNFMINNEKLEGTVNGVENEIQTTGNEIGTNISRKDVTEIENKINKSNDVKQADTNKLKEVALIEQTHKIQDIVVLNLGKTTGTLTEDKIINSDDTILDLEKNVNDMTNKEMIEASVNGIIDNEERHNTSLKISRKDVTEIKNNNVELKEMSLKKQHNKKDSLLMEDLDESYESSEEEWNPTDHSEDEFDMDIITSAVPTKRENNYATQKLKFRCAVENCDAAYRKKWLLEDHIRKHNKERPFHCTIEDCKKSFTKEAHLKRHNILVHEKSGELACDVKGCGLIYNNKYSLKKHKNQVHNALKWPFFCNECCIGFKKKWQLNQHNYKHTGEPPFKCTMCNIGFTVQRDLTKHNRNHKTYSCDCGEIFERWSHLNHHKKKCSAKKDNICKICDKKFSKKENLTAHHASIHQESKELELFHCPYLNCTRSYKYKKNVNFHISSFHEKNNREEIPCPTCGKIFQMPLYLNRHLEKMHKLPKISKPRATRKDKNKSRTYTAAVLAGLKLSQKDHMDFLKNPEKQLIVRITRIDLGEIETKVNSSNDNVKQIRSNELKYIGLTEQSSKKDDILILNLEKTGQLSEDNIIIEDKSKNCQTQIDSEQNIQLKVLNDMHRTELSVNGILQIEEQTTSPHKINTRIEENISTFSDDVVVACNSVLKIIEECIL